MHSPSRFAIKVEIYGVFCNQFIYLSLSVLLKHLVIGQRQKAPNFSAFIGRHTVVWFPLVSLSSHEGSTFTERTEKSLIIELDRSGPNRRIGPVCAGLAYLQQLFNLNNCSNFYENIFDGFKVVERTLFSY